MAAVLLFSCSCVCSAPSPARWINSVLNAALCPRDQLCDATSALHWEGWPVTPPLKGGLLPHSLSQPLCLSRSLLRVSGSSGRLRLACHPAPALSLCCFGGHHQEFCAETSAPCPIPVFLDRFSVPPPPPLLVLDYSCCLCFSILQGGISLLRGYPGLFNWGWG
jgi:hypothetical protein